MSGNEKFLSDIREAVKAMTEADPYFAGIDVISERIKDIQNKIDQTIGALGGVAIVLVTPVLGGTLTNVPGSNFKDIKLVGRVLENVTLNDTDKEALNVAIYLHALWSQMKPDQLAAPLRPDEPSIMLGNDPKYLSYDVIFSTEGGMKIDLPRLDQVTIDATDPDAIDIVPPTAGAAIYYTVDGSQPAPRNPSAILLLAPFSVAAGTAIRARAWLAGYLPSAETRLTV